MKKIVAFVFMLQFMSVSSQEYFPKNDGVKSENQNYTAFVNAEIHISLETTQTELWQRYMGKFSQAGE